jgi:hypothetical protein
MDDCLGSSAAHEVLDQGGLAGTRFGRNGDDASVPIIRSRECLAETLYLIIAL